jgi:membrane protein DedA with SNARE-associated domain
VQYLLLHYGYAFLVLGIILEGDATVVAAAILAGQQYFNLNWVLGLAMGVSILANEALYEIGRRGKIARKLPEERRCHVAGWLHNNRFGLATLFFSRFMWGFRLMIPIAAGALHIRRRRFVLCNFFGGVLWSLVLVYFGVALQSWVGSIQKHLNYLHSPLAFTLLLFGLAISIASIPLQLRRRHHRKPASIIMTTTPAPWRPNGESHTAHLTRSSR